VNKTCVLKRVDEAKGNGGENIHCLLANFTLRQQYDDMCSEGCSSQEYGARRCCWWPWWCFYRASTARPLSSSRSALHWVECRNSNRPCSTLQPTHFSSIIEAGSKQRLGSCPRINEFDSRFNCRDPESSAGLMREVQFGWRFIIQFAFPC
jgi:hypothetical protein